MTQQKDFDLLETWEECALKWQEQGLSQEQVFQMFIDAEVIPANKVFDSNYSFPYCLLPANEEEYKNFLMYDYRGDEPFYIALFNKFFPYQVEWLYRDEDISNIPRNQLIHFNHVNPVLEWKSIKNFYFKCNEHYYNFFIYDFMSREWVNEPSIIAVFHQILQYFNINKTIYEVGDIRGCGKHYFYFSAHPEKFKKINQTLQTPFKDISNFFIPEPKTPQFLKIEPQYKQIIANQGFISSLNQNFIEIPKTESTISNNAQQWLISMIGEMRSQALQHLNQNDFSQKAIEIRNLFVSLALNMIADYCVSHNLKKHVPLWQTNRYQDDILDQQQQIALLDDIFNPEDLAKHLTYPY